MHGEPLDRPSPSPAPREASTTESPNLARRRGGREARRELRAKPIPTEEMAVGPGLVGGRYRALSAAEVERIHGAALEILEQVGLSDAIPSCIDIVTAAGGMLGNDGRLRFPPRWSRTPSRGPPGASSCTLPTRAAT
jgi:trimethylamine:corrinoid methyltransferase-like protein